MAKVIRRENEELESLIKRFNRQVKAANTLYEVSKHEYFLPKSLRRQEKSKRAHIKAIQDEKAMRKYRERTLEDRSFTRDSTFVKTGR